MFVNNPSLKLSNIFIMIILKETALVFVKEGDFASLNQLLSPVEFSRLKPLVLLLSWPYCYSCENAKNLLNALWNPLVRFLFLILTKMSSLHSIS